MNHPARYMPGPTHFNGKPMVNTSSGVTVKSQGTDKASKAPAKKGVILCGGLGTRLRPATLIYNKHLALVYDKPMVLYPLQTLKDMGIVDIMLISGGGHVGLFEEFLGDGSEYGVNLTYKVQKEAGGIAEALKLAQGFVSGPFVVILGDNYFETPPRLNFNSIGLVIKSVEHPERFGVYAQGGKIIEKPKEFVGNQAVLGIYGYTPEIFQFLHEMQRSARGELEITDLNNWCLSNLVSGWDVETPVIEYTGFWSDMGTPDSLLEAANFIKSKKTI